MEVLVVDSDADVQLLFEHGFRKEVQHGEIVFAFHYSGESALEHLRAEPQVGVVLILSDIHMPGMTGLQLLKGIKRERPEIPVIMLANYEGLDDDDCTRHGADGLITKPIDFLELKHKVYKLLERGASTR